MSAMPLVSVIVVNYNAGALLAECVTAVLGSTLAVEVIVSDNGSVDDSLTRLRARVGADARLRIVENGANLGFAAGNNRALPLAGAPWLLFLNPDCIVAPDTLGRMVEALEAHPEAGIAGCMVRDPDGAEQVACRRAIPDPWIALRRLLGLERLGGAGLDQRHLPPPREPVTVEATSGSFMFVRRAALEQVGPLDEGYFLHCEDLDWFVRFAEAGWRVLLVPGVEVVHHKGACSGGDPLAVERHKHRGMERFYRKFQYRRYPRPFSWLVILGIRLHLGLLVARQWLRRGRAT
ncbi:glycosyltransferase family 2 protein [Marichromatium sp. PS1]|uniref:glycosyltransferase family 2 protein n=1 Tax=Marichromatium sp. PS1 TaxID=3138932 RepID=UPI0032E6B391